MSEKKFETASLLVDEHELSNEQLDQLINDEQLNETWDRHHLIGDVMRNEVPDFIALDLSKDIAAAIDAEPTVLAPKQSTPVWQRTKAKVVQFAKPFGQIAIAASAAGLMIMGVQTNVAENETITPAQQVVQTIPLGGIADPVSFNYSTQERTSQKQAYIEQQRRFQALLADHQQQIKLSSVTQPNDTLEQEQKVEDTPK